MGEELTSFIDKVASRSHLRVEADLGGGFVRLRTDEAERRQARHDIRSIEDAFIELLRNARDAGAHNIFVATARMGEERRTVVVDDGCGIPERLHDAVFQARVTSKLDTIREDRWGVHGRGMALFSIRENAEEARIACSASGLGTAVFVRTNVSRVKERTDQSSWPDLSFDEEGNLTVRGPRNINRTLAEFALAEQDACTVYLGSPVEIATTLYAYGLATTTASARTFACNPAEMPVTKRLGSAADPAEFASLAAGLGIDLSERSARRAMDGSIAPLAPLLETVRISRPDDLGHKSEARVRDVLGDMRGLRIAPQDLESFRSRLREAWQDVASAYFLDSSVEPVITVRKDAVHVSFPARKAR